MNKFTAVILIGLLTLTMLLSGNTVMSFGRKKEPPKMTPVEAGFEQKAGGLQIKDDVIGTGDEAQAGQMITVHYTGTLYEGGKKFDSSKDRGEPFQFPLGAGRVIKGWDQGFEGMKVGGKRTLIIPASMGYGAQGAPPVIPGNATLKFEVELLGVN
jgi:FKBP-type peptidyl-prolyl cis-trans isomerase FkpA